MSAPCRALQHSTCTAAARTAPELHAALGLEFTESMSENCLSICFQDDFELRLSVGRPSR